MALAVGNQMLGFAFAPEYKEETTDYWTINWWANLKSENLLEPENSWNIGAHSSRTS
jgi:hypothetical protein